MTDLLARDCDNDHGYLEPHEVSRAARLNAAWRFVSHMGRKATFASPEEGIIMEHCIADIESIYNLGKDDVLLPPPQEIDTGD